LKFDGAEALLKRVTDEGLNVTQNELVTLFSKHEPIVGETREQTFARHYSSDLSLRKAVEVAKQGDLAAAGVAHATHPFV
jgi:hypothetical protein